MSKTITCREMGGTCDEGFSGESLKEISDQGYAHVQGAADDEHKALFEKMQASTPEEMAAWNTKMEAVFAEKPDNA